MEELDPLTRAGFAHGRALAIVLHAIDAHFLPYIVSVALHSHLWAKLNPTFSTSLAIEALDTSSDDVAKAADGLLWNAHTIDPLGPLYELVRHAQPDVWKELKGGARCWRSRYLNTDRQVSMEMVRQHSVERNSL